MAVPKPIPLYPTYAELKEFSFKDYPDLDSFLKTGDSWWPAHWQWGREFLDYIGRNKSEHTFTRFRNETERFLLWLYLFKSKPMDQLRGASHFLPHYSVKHIRGTWSCFRIICLDTLCYTRY